MKSDKLDLPEEAEARSKIYYLLSSYCYNPSFSHIKEPPDKLPLLVETHGDFLQGLAIIKEFLAKPEAKEPEKLRNILGVEFTRLFRGVSPGYGPPSPYEHVYRDEALRSGKRRSEEAPVNIGEVLEIYHEAGTQFYKETSDLPDYIGIELEFMGYLIKRESECWRQKNRLDAVEYLKMEKKFLNEHLLLWIPDFCERIITEARVDFYRGLGLFIKDYLNFDNQLISTLLGEDNEHTG